MALCVKSSGTWRNITTQCVRSGGSWRKIGTGCIRSGGTWRKFGFLALGDCFEGGWLVCKSGGTYLIAAPNTSEAPFQFNARTTALNCACCCSGCTSGWFIPSCSQMTGGAPIATCRQYWITCKPSYQPSGIVGYWSDTFACPRPFAYSGPRAWGVGYVSPTSPYISCPFYNNSGTGVYSFAQAIHGGGFVRAFRTVAY